MTEVKVTQRLRQSAMVATLQDLDDLAQLWVDHSGTEAEPRWVVSYSGGRTFNVSGSISDAFDARDVGSPNRIELEVGGFRDRRRFSLEAHQRGPDVHAYITGDDDVWIQRAQEATRARLRTLRPWWHWLRQFPASALFGVPVSYALLFIFTVGGNRPEALGSAVAGILGGVVGGLCGIYLVPGLVIGAVLPLASVVKRALLALVGLAVSAVAGVLVSGWWAQLFG